MTLALLTWPIFQAWDSNGLPLAFGKLYAYAAGTDTPQALFTSDGSTPAANPIILDALGRADVRLGPNSYKLNLLSTLNAQQPNFPVDNISSLAPTVLGDYSATVAQMKLRTDPGELGSESLATAMSGELERLRYALYETKAAMDPSITEWYETPYGSRVCNVQAYGADPTGVADSTSAFTAAIAAAAAGGMGLYGCGTFKLSTITVLNGVKSFVIDGTLQDSGVNTDITTSLSSTFPVGVVVLDGPKFTNAGVVSDLYFQANINITNGCRAAIVADGSLNCVFAHCRIVGPSDTSVGQIGILLNAGCGNIVIRDCTIVFGGNAPTQFQEGINGWGTDFTKNNYYNNGGMDNMTDPASPLSNIRIYGNDLIGGSHGINMSGSQHVQIFGNRIHNHRDRGIELFGSMLRCSVVGNVITDFKSSAVTSGNGMHTLYVADNMCYTSIGNGEAALQCYLGGRNLHFVNNYILGLGANTFGHGVYVGCDIQEVFISGNTITYPRIAAIAVDSDWKIGNVVGSPALFYGRINAAAPPTGTEDAFVNTFDIVIANNVIYNGLNAYGSLAAISLNQVKTRTLTNTYIHGNRVMGNNMLYNLACYQETASSLTGVRYLGNASATVGPSQYGLSNGMGHFECFDYNDLNTEYQLTATTTTPSVLGNIKRVTCSSAGLITNFTNPMTAQVLTVRLDAASGLQNNANIYLRGGADIAVAAATTSYFVTLVYTSGKWFETARNF